MTNSEQHDEPLPPAGPAALNTSAAAVSLLLAGRLFGDWGDWSLLLLGFTLACLLGAIADVLIRAPRIK